MALLEDVRMERDPIQFEPVPAKRKEPDRLRQKIKPAPFVTAWPLHENLGRKQLAD